MNKVMRAGLSKYRVSPLVLVCITKLDQAHMQNTMMLDIFVIHAIRYSMS